MYFASRPGLYYVRESEVKFPNSNVTSYYLQYYKERFDIPTKLYGDIKTNCVRVWNQYVTSKQTTAALFTGLPGTGKTLSAEIISNIAIDNNMPVIMCIEIEYTIDLIRFLAQLSNCVIFIDEFAKVTGRSIMDNMLSMLSDVNTTNKLILLTENDPRTINRFILNRPGRVRYHFDSNRLSKAVFEDYCKHFDITPKFFAELESKYRKAKEFSFDQLQVIVDEHLKYPDEELDKLLNVLNLSGLNKAKQFDLLYIKTEDEDTDISDLGFKYAFTIMGTHEDYKDGYGSAKIEVYYDNIEDKEEFMRRSPDTYRFDYSQLEFDGNVSCYVYPLSIRLGDGKEVNCKAYISYE